MRFMEWEKDGGPKSHVDAFYIVEIKPLFSIIVLRFSDGTREAYHNHAFNAISWLLRGRLIERTKNGWMPVNYWPSFKSIWTPRNRFHQVASRGVSWAITFRGPWASNWKEFTRERGIYTLTHGRREV